MVKKMIILFSIIAVLSMGTLSENEPRPSASEVLTKYNEMVSRLSCLSMRILTRWSGIPLDLKYTVHEIVMRVSRNGQDLDLFGTEKISDVNGVCVREKVICHMFMDGKHYTAYKWPIGKKPKDAQIDYNSEYVEDLQRIFLGSPEFGSSLWSRLDGCEGKTIPELLNMAADLELSVEMVELCGLRCYVLRGSTKYGVITAWIAPERSYNAVKWIVKKGPKDLYNDRPVVHGEVTRIFEAIDFVKIDDVFVLSKGRFTAPNRDTDGTQTLTYEFELSDIKLNPDFVALGAFKFKIPDGTPVIIMEHPGIRYIWKDGRAVPDVEGLAFDEIDKILDQSEPFDD
jgi:hypothetical protein